MKEIQKKSVGGEWVRGIRKWEGERRDYSQLEEFSEVWEAGGRGEVGDRITN